MKVETRGKVERRDVTIDLEPLRYIGQTKIDGDLGETESLTEIVLEKRENILPSDPGVAWDGPRDLSARSWFGWNEKAFYLAVRVTDDVHHAPVWEGPFWNSDSLQLAVDVANDSALGFDRESDRELGFVLAPDGRFHAYRTFPGVHRQECELNITREGTVTTYEVSIPWSAMDVEAPREGRVMAINYAVNENDGKGRACRVGPSAGIVEAKEPGLYKEFVLLR